MNPKGRQVIRVKLTLGGGGLVKCGQVPVGLERLFVACVRSLVGAPRVLGPLVLLLLLVLDMDDLGLIVAVNLGQELEVQVHVIIGRLVGVLALHTCVGRQVPGELAGALLDAR